ncbi:MAG TPA: hypothetical protein VK738_08160 [Terriglobales bacterium]|nr:hypothetical protein [Terriglobales bacterium]
MRRRWVRAIAITAVCILTFAAISAAGECLFYLNGNKTILLMELTIWTWLLLLFVFVARRWSSRILLVIAALSVLVIAPGCILTLGPVVRVGLYLHMTARTVHASVVGSRAVYPTEMPPSAMPLRPLVERQYEFHYAVFGDPGNGANSHFRIEAVRRHCLCRALTNLTIFDDGTIYSTDENRAAKASDGIFYKPPKDAEFP